MSTVSCVHFSYLVVLKFTAPGSALLHVKNALWQNMMLTKQNIDMVNMNNLNNARYFLPSSYRDEEKSLYVVW